MCGLVPMSSTSGIPWWVSPLQGTDWRKLRDYISETVCGDSMYQDKSITNQNVSSWPVISKIQSSPGHNQTFSYPQTIKILTDLINPQINTHQPGPKLQNPTYHYAEGGKYQIWDTYCGSRPLSDNSVKRQFYAGSKEIIYMLLGKKHTTSGMAIIGNTFPHTTTPGY